MSHLPATILLGLTGIAALAQDLPSPPPGDVDPLVKASAYGDKLVWSYHDSKPVPWSIFRPKDYGSAQVAFDGGGVRPVGRVPAPGVHPRLFFSPEDLPALRKRLKEDRGGREAWKNVLAWSHALRLSYDEHADYAEPDWANGAFGIHGRFVDLMRIGGYGSKREDYLAILAAGGKPARYEKDSAAEFFKPAAVEAFRCLVDDDAEGARTLAKATVTAIRLEQERRARADKPVAPGEPPRPSTSRSAACGLGLVYDFIFNYLTPEQQRTIHDELVTLSAWSDNYGTFNNAEASRSNWATFSYWVFDLMAIEGEPGFNDLKFLGLYRGWRDFFTYSFFASGAAYEAEGKLLFGLDAVVAFDRVGWKYGLEPLSHHPLPRAYYGAFSACAMLPTRDRFAVFDILGGIDGGFTTPHDLVVARYLFPQDRTTDTVYRALVGDDYRTLPASIHSHWNQAVISAIFAASHDPQATPDRLGLPESFFCGQRALMMTRSSWDRDATFLTMHVRGASGGHPYPDRCGIMLTGKGRAWVTIPGKDAGSWACSTVVIDGAAQNPTTPGRVVDYADTPQATFMTGDASYCWDWVWSTATKRPDGKEIIRADVDAGAVDTHHAWSLVDQTFNDFAFTRSDYPLYARPLKYNASWIAKDGILEPIIRQVNNPVLASFRTAGVVRGTRPYVLVVDDAQRDDLPARYDWNLTLMADVVRVGPAAKVGEPADIVLAGKDSIGADGAPRSGEPVLLVRVLEAAGRRLPDQVGLRERVNLLTISTVAAAPRFKVLIYAFRSGDPLPATAWDGAHRVVSVSFPGQEDAIACAPSSAGRTELAITRAGKAIATLNRPIAPVADPATARLVERQRRIGSRVEALRARHFDPAALPGFVAGWKLDALVGGAFVPMAGSGADARPIPPGAGISVAVDSDGRKAAAIGADPLAVAIDPKAIPPGPITVSVWVKTRPGPFMGRLVDIPGVVGFDFVQGGLWFSVPGSRPLASWSSAMLSSWTHLAVTWDGATVTGYRNGMPLTTDASPRKIALGKLIRLGGADAYGNADVQARELMLYRGALSAQDIEDLHLWGRHGEDAR